MLGEKNFAALMDRCLVNFDKILRLNKEVQQFCAEIPKLLVWKISSIPWDLVLPPSRTDFYRGYPFHPKGDQEGVVWSFPVCSKRY